MSKLRVILGALGALVVLVATSTGISATPSLAASTLAWSISASPNAGIGGGLEGVSCKSRTFCQAVGSYEAKYIDHSEGRALLESWNGKSWSLETGPNRGSGPHSLVGVSCSSTTSCKAVGSYGTGPEPNRTLIESWNGTKWSLMTSPNQGTNASVLFGVSCVSPTLCKAVGTWTSATEVSHTLVESWNGTTWSIESAPNPGAITNALFGVSCITASSCYAVGNTESANLQLRTLVEHWNGTKWSAVSSPNSGTAANYLDAVSCVSSLSCKAVGFHNSDFTLVESWNGVRWTVEASPNRGSNDNDLTSVSCSTAASCKAVGIYRSGNVLRQLIESWNGQSWSLDSSPNRGTGYNELGSVSCPLSTSCKAAGGSVSLSGLGQTLIDSYG